MYERRNTKMEWASELLHFGLVKISAPLNIISPALVSFYYYISRRLKRTIETILLCDVCDLNASDFRWFKLIDRLLAIFRYPFDWQTPYGFLASNLIQTVTTVFYVQAFLCPFILTCGLSWFLTTFGLDISERLCELNKGLAFVKNRKISTKQRIEKKKIFNDIIRFHSDAVQLSFQNPIRLHS